MTPRYFEERPDSILHPTSRICVSICTGSLAAAAILCSTSLSDLISIGNVAVRVAFRAGLYAGTAADAIENDVEVQESWSTIVADVSADVTEASLNDFHQNAKIDPLHQLYISCFGPSTVTISGPPSISDRFFQGSANFRLKNKITLPVYAPYHAGHIFSIEDVNRILDEDDQNIVNSYQPTGKFYSAGTGKCHQASNAPDLFRLAVSDMLYHPVHWSELLETITRDTKSSASKGSRIISVGANNLSNSLLSSIRAVDTETFLEENTVPAILSLQETTSRTQSDKIAIVGMAGRFPEAENHDELWDILTKGLDVHKEIPRDRFNPETHYDPSGKGKNKSHTPYGCFIREPGLFDPQFFSMSPREAAQTDPMGRLALVTAYEALEMSGYVPNRTPSTKLNRIGTFYGQTSDDWREINAAENIDTYFITGGVRAFAPGRINYFFKFSGPSYSIDTACSSSLAAIQLACTSLWAGECDTACAGGVNVLTNPDIFAGLSKGQFLSKTGSCKTFDNAADGYCRGDGCGTLILKRYQDAIKDNDNILGCILGAGTNHSADAISITHPHAGAQEFLYKKVLTEAGVDAHEVNYIEMHGTGTQAGDNIEMTSVTNVFAPRNRPRKHDQPLYLGSLKANIGHGEAASGISAMIKCLMMLQKNLIPPNVGVKGILNQTFPSDLTERNVHIPFQQVAIPRKSNEKRKLLVNNFSAAGGNSAVLLEDGPMRILPKNKDPRRYHIVTVTARSISSLKRNINNLIEYLDRNPELQLPSLSYTTTARRIQHLYRVSVVASDILDVRAGLFKQIKNSYSPVAVQPTKVFFVFTGQGAQYVGLGRDLYTDLCSFSNEVNQLDTLARRQGLPSFLPLITGTDLSSLSPVVVQLGLVCIQVALARVWESWGVKPSAVIGHSLGEYAALHIAGVISASSMITLVGQRAQLLVTHCTESTHGMLAVKASVQIVEEILGADMLEIACKNSPSETVLSGTLEALKRANGVLQASGVKATLLELPYAFHSAQVDPILKSYNVLASSVTYKRPKIPIFSPLTGGIVRKAGIIDAEYLVRHARQTVEFCTALSTVASDELGVGKSVWLEIGSHPICSNMIGNSLGDSPNTAYSLKKGENNWKTISSNICSLYNAGVSVNFNEYHASFSRSHELLALPTYAFNNKTYWLDYHNDWCLIKGETPIPVREPEGFAKRSKLSTTSCHKIVYEDLQINSGKLIIQSDLTDPMLSRVISGHMVNGSPLCPSSLYADMALTIADYFYKQLRPDGPQIGMNVCNMEVSKPLIAKLPPPPEGQYIEVEGAADLNSNQVQLQFRSVSPKGELILEHGKCLVKYEGMADWTDTWRMTQYLVQAQVDLLHHKLQSGTAHKILRGVAYKLFRALVTYDENYRGMEEIILNDRETEATAQISFQTDQQSGTFFCSPYWIDSLCHISGFVVNATDLIDSAESVYISHGWNAMRFAKSFSPKKKYRSYVRMQPQSNNIRAGDVYIFEDENIVGVVNGVKFQQIPRKLLNTFLPPTNLGSPSKPIQEKQMPNRAFPVSKPTKDTTSISVEEPLSLISRVMDILATESGLDQSELTMETAFENTGVDSLMSLTMTTRIREELDIDIPSTLFIEFSTIGEMQKFLVQHQETFAYPSSSEVSLANTPLSSGSDSIKNTTPESSVGDGDEIADSSISVRNSGPSIIRQSIAQELGIDIAEVTDDADLAGMGMDSLMSLMIITSLRESAGINLPSTFFLTNTTIKQAEEALDLRPQPKLQVSQNHLLGAPGIQRHVAQKQIALTDNMLNAGLVDLSDCPPATSFLLQGNARRATRNLFLLPDGSGSATSYMHIPPLHHSIAIYGLNCPFMRNPTEYTIGVRNVSRLFLNEVRRIQPKGPYYIGGWSAGGVMAYEVTLQLMAMGEKVSKLFLIDSPCPVSLKPLPTRLFKFFDDIGLLGSRGTGSSPSWLIPHFEYSVQNLAEYEPAPMLSGSAPATIAIWAKEGVCENMVGVERPRAGGDEPKTMKWLLDKRTDFGDNGWAQLLGQNAISCQIMGGNHFTMMTNENVSSKIFSYLLLHY